MQPCDWLNVLWKLASRHATLAGEPGGAAMRPRAAEKMTRKPAPPKTDNRFRYGWRDVEQVGPDGRTELVQVPLTLENVLHPQEGYVIPEAIRHERERGYLAKVYRGRLSRLRGALVTSDCIIDWGVLGI